MNTTGQRIMAAASYLSWILFIIMYLINRNTADGFMRRHLNQAFVLNVVASTLGLLTRFGLAFLSTIGGIVVLAFLIWGVIYALMGKTDRIPLIGSVDLF